VSQGRLRRHSFRRLLRGDAIIISGAQVQERAAAAEDTSKVKGTAAADIKSVEEFVRFLRLPVYRGHLPFAFLA
jgi:hypothetical protein